MHRYDLDTDRCTCGGCVVWFEDPDKNGKYGEGCEVAEKVWAKPEYATPEERRRQRDAGNWD